MSNYLAIDTSSRYLTVLAQRGDKRIIRHIPDCSMQHSVVLMGEVEAALKKAGLTPKECDFFAAVTGPGSFTGIRIGISTVKGLALGAKKPLLGLTSFELIAYNVKSENFTVIIDAAHSHYYAQGFGRGAFPPSYLSFEEVKNLKTELYGFEELPFENYRKLEVKNCLHPAISSCESNLSGDISALYVRKSQAEEGRGTV